MSTRTVRLVAGCAAACAIASAAVAEVGLAQGGGQPARAAVATPKWDRSRLDNRLDERTRVAVERVIDSATAAGLPADPLVSKALQGAAMGARGDAIVKAVRVLVGRLDVARDALGATSDHTELDAGVAALQAGVSPDDLARLRRDRAGQLLAVPLGVLADLIGRGVPPRDATQSVLALTRHGTTDEQLVAFQRDVERDIGIGAPPAAAVELRALSLTRTGGIPGGGPLRPSKPKP